LHADENTLGAEPAKPAAIALAIDAIEPNPDQPRRHVAPDALADLAESIRAHGIIQPIVARALGEGRYQLVAGERRWRAAKIAGLLEIPVVIRDVSDDAVLAICLVENLDREDMAPGDEVAAVALLATSDIEALYELAKLAEDDEEAARRIVASHGEGGHLRDQVKAAAKASKSSAPNIPAEFESEDPDSESFSHAKPNIDRERGSADLTHERSDYQSESDGSESEEDEGDIAVVPGSRSKGRALVVTAAFGKEERIVLVTENDDEVPCEFRNNALEQLRRLLEL